MTHIIKNIKLAVFLAIVPLLSSCWQIETILRIHPNGSGEIIETVMFSHTFLELMQGMKNMGMKKLSENEDATSEKPVSIEDMLNEMIDMDEIKNKENSYGGNVSLTGVEKIKNDTFAGYRASYKFNDINSIQVLPETKPSTKNKTPGVKEESESNIKKETIKFKFQKKNPAILTVIMPDKEPEKEHQDENPDATEDTDTKENMPPQMMELFRDMKFAVKIQVDGTVKKTNASFINDGIITLLEIDFSKMMKNQEKFKMFMKENPSTAAEMKTMMTKIDGLKFETQKEINIEFE